MFSSISQYVTSFKYTQLGQSPEASDPITARLQVRPFRFLTSKKLAIIAAASLLVLLVAFFHFANTDLSLSDVSRGWSSDSDTQHGADAVHNTSGNAIDWSHFAYTQYATNAPYLCNSVMLFEILHRLGSKAERLLMYPSGFEVSDVGRNGGSNEALLLRKARDNYNVKLSPIDVVERSSSDLTWAESYTKLLAFNQTQYRRVLSLDSDSTVLQTMDELFLLPSVPLALPRAYWLDFKDRTMSSQVLLIQPSTFEYERVAKAIKTANADEYDMEIVNNLYKDSAMILPHRPYDMVTGEFRNMGSHVAYMGSEEESFDPELALKEAKFLHFSDWPVEKPWVLTSPEIIEEKKPPCIRNQKTNSTDCRQQKIWLGLYEDFARRRKEVCDLDVSLPRKRRWANRFLNSDPIYEPLFQ